MNFPGFIYLLAEGDLDRINAFRNGKMHPEFFKLGKAEWGKRRQPSARPFAPVEDRLARAQSCNPRKVGCIRILEFEDDQAARRAEVAFHHQHRKTHGVQAYDRHEWYRDSLLISACETWLSSHGGIDVTNLFPSKATAGGYEEGPCEKGRGATSRINPLSIYLMKLEDEGAWWRVLATSYRANPAPWYNTGNPRKVSLTKTLAAVSHEDPAARNSRVKAFMAELLAAYGDRQSPAARKPDALWNTLCWVKEPKLDQHFSVLALKHEL